MTGPPTAPTTRAPTPGITRAVRRTPPHRKTHPRPTQKTGHVRNGRPEQEREPAQDQQPDKEHDPAREHPPPSSPTETDSPANDTPDPAEPRSRQEHAAPPIDGPGSRTERQEKSTKESGPNEDSNADYKDASNLERETPYGDSVEPGSKTAEATHPRTEQERAEHIGDVFARLDKADAEGSSSNELHTIDPKGEIWSTDRTQLHHSLLDEIYSRAADVPCDHEAIVAGGLSGAGKTTVLANHPEIDRSRYLTINPDNLKEEMARRGMIPEVEGLSPMEASELVHEESSYLARQLAIRAQADGKNLIWDITMSDQAKTEQRIVDLREAGYTKIQALFVQIPIETSLERTESRYWEDQEKWLAGEGLGGRLIPPEVILRQADDEWGSGNRKTFEAIKGVADIWEIRDNSVDGEPATLVDRGQHGEAMANRQREQRS